MPIVDSQITGPGWPGLGIGVQNALMHWAGFPGISSSNNVYTTAVTAATGTTSALSTTTTGAGSTVSTLVSLTSWATVASVTAAAGTQLDVCRNVQFLLSATSRSSQLVGGGVTVFGVDLLGKTQSDTQRALTLGSATALQSGSVNLVQIDTISVGLQLTAMFRGSTITSASDGATTTSSSGSTAPAFSIFIGRGQQLGVLPITYRSSNAVLWAIFGTAPQTTTSATASTSANQFTNNTGPDYWNGGFVMSSNYSSATLLQLSYKGNGWR